jgi:hypothetical protein
MRTVLVLWPVVSVRADGIGWVELAINLSGLESSLPPPTFRKQSALQLVLLYKVI